MDSAEQTTTTLPAVEPRAATPIAGAIAGILFALLFTISISILITTLTDLGRDTGAWLQDDARTFKLALGLIPFAGLFFLWFIAVARERLGAHEDQFFTTVFLGSGLLFLAMVFAAAASAGALIATYAQDPVAFAGTSTYVYGRYVVTEIFTVYAVRMAAVFMLSQSTLWLRTGVMPRWMAYTTVAIALVLLFVFTQSPWVVLVFPAWVFLFSAYILVSRRHRPY
jgi:hypothetical protein